MTRLQQSVSRRVTFQAKCAEGMCAFADHGAWKGPERETKWQASYDLAGHNTDRHGGAERIGAEE